MATSSNNARSLPVLPPELIDLIVQFGAEVAEDSNYPRFCMNAALVCQAWTDSALRQVYARLVLANEEESMMSLVIPLLHSPNFGRYPIREIIWTHERACDSKDLLYVFKLLSEREGLEKLAVLEFSFPIGPQPIPSLDLPDLLRFTPGQLNRLPIFFSSDIIGVALRLLCTNDARVRLASSNTTYPPPASPQSQPSLEVHISCEESVLLTNEKIPVLDRLRYLSTSEIFAESEEVEPHEQQVLGLTDRILSLQLEKLGSRIGQFQRTDHFHFPRLIGMHLDFAVSEIYPLQSDFFENWETPVLRTVSSFASPTRNIFSLLAKWLGSSAFRNVIMWRIDDQHPIDIYDLDCIQFFEACGARNIQLVVKQWNDV